jgi:hypothetical protein
MLSKELDLPSSRACKERSKASLVIVSQRFGIWSHCTTKAQ